MRILGCADRDMEIGREEGRERNRVNILLWSHIPSVAKDQNH